MFWRDAPVLWGHVMEHLKSLRYLNAAAAAKQKPFSTTFKLVQQYFQPFSFYKLVRDVRQFDF